MMGNPIRWLAATSALLVAMVVIAGPAAAEFTTNEIGCAGSAVVTNNDGDTYTVDADDSTVEVPRTGSADWEGSTQTVTHNHTGEVAVDLGFTGITIGDWASENAGDASSSSGVTELPAILRQVPTGKYDVSGFHDGDEGRCAGSVVVEIDGSPFDTVVGILNLVLTLLTAALLGFSMVAVSSKPAFRGRPILGALAGLLFGFFLAIELVFFKAISSGSIIVTALPIVFLAVGAIGAFTAPLGRGRQLPPTPPAPPVEPAPPASAEPAAP